MVLARAGDLIDDPTRIALFLDLDGTIIDIAPTPEAVIVPPELTATVAGLSRGLAGALAIITGRPMSDVDRFLHPLRPVAAGVHGAELRLAEGGPVTFDAEGLDDNLVEAVKRLEGIASGILVEPKGRSIAVHYRQAPAAGDALMSALEPILASYDDRLVLCPGRKVLEIVPRRISKGGALATIAALPAFGGRRPVMIGDDTSDVSAFAAATSLGGVGLKVAGESFSSGEADFRGPSAVRSWLSALAERLTS